MVSTQRGPEIEKKQWDLQSRLHQHEQTRGLVTSECPPWLPPAALYVSLSLQKHMRGWIQLHLYANFSAHGQKLEHAFPLFKAAWHVAYA